jgi:hypothetical protein
LARLVRSHEGYASIQTDPLPGILRGGTLIMSPADAIAMVERARQLNVRIRA